jgi:hypothetical protein
MPGTPRDGTYVYALPGPVRHVTFLVFIPAGGGVSGVGKVAEGADHYQPRSDPTNTTCFL